MLDHFTTDRMKASPEVRYCWGYWYEHEGILDSALIYYNLNLRDPNSNKIMDQLAAGRVQYRMGDYQKAFDLFWDVQRKDSCFGDVRYYLGMTLWEMGEKKGAAYSYQNQLKCNPKDTTTLHNLAVAYSDMGKYNEEIETLIRKQQYHLSASDMIDMSLAYHRIGNDSMAFATLGACEHRFGPSARSLTYRATIWYHVDEQDSAVADLTKALAIDSTYDEAVNMTNALYKKGYFPNGTRLYEFSQRNLSR